MAKELLSDTTLSALKAGTTAYYGKKRVDDGGGLYLLLAVEGGGGAWRNDYTIARKRKTISLGMISYTPRSLTLQTGFPCVSRSLRIRWHPIAPVQLGA